MTTVSRFALCALVVAGALAALPARAQFGTSFPGFFTIPKDDFTWIWGDLEERDLKRRPDFDVRGGEASFRCELTGELRVSSRMQQPDIRQLEQTLTTSLAFIQESAQTMNILTQQLDLDWARLECKHPEVDEDAAAEQERLDRAVEKAIRARERRRAREDD